MPLQRIELFVLGTILLLFVVVRTTILRQRQRRSIVVSDTSVITNLAGVDLLWLLRHYFGIIYVCPQVYAEMRSPAPRNVAVKKVRAARWIRRHVVRDLAYAQRLMDENAHLDRGEAESIVLALELPARRLLIDDGTGRAVARNLGIEIKGLLAMLIDAKNDALISSVRPVMDVLMTEPFRFRISPALYNEVLRLTGELDT